MYHVIGKVAVCAVVCITVMDSVRSTRMAVISTVRS